MTNDDTAHRWRRQCRSGSSRNCRRAGDPHHARRKDRSARRPTPLVIRALLGSRNPFAAFARASTIQLLNIAQMSSALPADGGRRTSSSWLPRSRRSGRLAGNTRIPLLTRIARPGVWTRALQQTPNVLGRNRSTDRRHTHLRHPRTGARDPSVRRSDHGSSHDEPHHRRRAHARCHPRRRHRSLRLAHNSRYRRVRRVAGAHRGVTAAILGSDHWLSPPRHRRWSPSAPLSRCRSRRRRYIRADHGDDPRSRSSRLRNSIARRQAVSQRIPSASRGRSGSIATARDSSTREPRAHSSANRH